MDQTTDQLHHTNVININLIDDIDEPPNPGMEIDEEEVKRKRNWLPKNEKYNIAFDLVKVLAENLPQFDKVNFGINVASRLW